MIPNNTVIVFIKGGCVEWAASSDDLNINLVIMDADSYELNDGGGRPINVWQENTAPQELDEEIQYALDRYLMEAGN